MNNSLIIFLVGPSGVGKTTVRKFITKKYGNINFLPSFTTRQPRDNEINGIDYFFISRPEFENYIQQNLLVEWEEHFDEFYGITQKLFTETIEGKSVYIKEIAIDGYKQLLEYTKQLDFSSRCIKTIFLMPDSIPNLITRIKSRNANNIENRIKNINAELETHKNCDVTVYSFENNIEKLCNDVEEKILKFINNDNSIL